ncbi:MAG: nqo13 [Myxococcaceae bacterium]|nr:nqo13 [Myxococcaceae bacterium]
MNFFDFQTSYDSRGLNAVIWLPVVFALLVVMLPKGDKGQIRVATLIAMLLDMGLAIWAFLRFQPGGREFQLEFRMPWINEIGVSYHLGVDGLAVSLVLLTGVLGPLVVLSSWSFVQERVKEFHLALLLLQTAMMGALCSVDTLLFYVFFEAMLVPMYLLIGVWGSEERQMAAMKFFLYTLVGSLLMLVAMLAVYFIAQPAGARTFDYAQLYNGLMAASREVSQCLKAGGEAGCDPTGLSATGAALLRFGPYMFFAFALAFAIKVPMFPVHTWLPDAHVQAPVAGSIVLAGVMLKMGTFGFWRFAVPLFPTVARHWQTPIAVLSVIGIVYGALMCLAQRDIKKLIAYSSVSHLGFCMLGIIAFTKEGASGSAYQMLNHGVSTGALFLLFGMLYERRHARLMSEYGGIAKVMPIYSAFFLIITFSSIAVPGTNGFVGEFLVLLGAFKSGLPLWFGVLAGTAVVLGAAYMLWMVQRVFFGPLANPENKGLKDLNKREFFTALPFVIMVLVMGLKPQPFLDVLAPSTDRYVARALWASDEGHLNEQQVKVRVRPNPAGPAGAPAIAPPPPTPVLGMPVIPTLRQMPPRIMQAPGQRQP